jgi:hypothetical protein
MVDGATDTVNAWAFLVAIVTGVTLGFALFLLFVEERIIKPWKKSPKNFILGTLLNIASTIAMLALFCWWVGK